MRPISGALQVARHLLMTDKAWLLFVTVPLRSGAVFRLVNASRHTHAGGFNFQACGMKIELPSEDVDGSLGKLAVTVPNISRIPMGYVDHDDADGEGQILGATITCQLAYDGDLTSFNPALSWKAVVLSVDADAVWFKVDCGHPASIGRGPRMRYTRKVFPQMLAQGPG